MIKAFPKLYETFDPNVVTNLLYKSVANGKCSIETKEPTVVSEPILVTSTTVPAGQWRVVHRIDPATKLVQRVEQYQLKDGQYEFMSACDYLEYNRPDPQAFVMNIPDDVISVDETTQVIGLPKENLTDAEITVKVAREFFEALIAKDYARAGQLYSGVPAAEMEKMFRKVNVLRIVSVGEARPHWIPGVGGMVVPVSVEIEAQGEKTVHEFRPAVRPVYSQKSRWAIHGGI